MQKQDPAMDAYGLRVGPRHLAAFPSPTLDQHIEWPHMRVMDATSFLGEKLGVLVHPRLFRHPSNHRTQTTETRDRAGVPTWSWVIKPLSNAASWQGEQPVAGSSRSLGSCHSTA